MALRDPLALGRPVVGDRVHERALLRAAGIVGGIDPLAERLQVDPAVLLTWIRGTAKVPPDVFLRIVDIVIERDLDAVISNPAWARRKPLKRDAP